MENDPARPPHPHPKYGKFHMFFADHFGKLPLVKHKKAFWKPLVKKIPILSLDFNFDQDLIWTIKRKH